MNEISAHPAGEENPGFLLWQVSTLWSSSTSVVLKSFGLTHPQFIILVTIDWLKNQEVVSQEVIARHIILDSKITSHLLRSLEVKGLIEPSRITNKKNKYLLTTAGTELLAKVLPVVENADAAFFASIDLKNSKIITTLQILARANLSKNDTESFGTD